jgi:prolyl oligopeptidase
VTYQSFLEPTTLFEVNGKTPKAVKHLPAKFNSKGMVTEQFEATSKDGTKIPYFMVHKKDMKLDGSTPTVQYGYGGFEIAETPFYLGSIGKVWLEKGGAYVVANIRGGGEFGPRWHEAALKENRQRAYGDFSAVTQDLFARKMTSPRRLGIQGGSNGGLLVGTTVTQHPADYHAVVCESALLDMIRYTKLPPGASWIGEYGDPADPKVAEYIAKFSPYQNVHANTQYPKIFFHISTADDRVQPGHTRKMVARLEQNGADVLMFENTEGGHGGAADLEQRVKKYTLEDIYLYQQLVD